MLGKVASITATVLLAGCGILDLNGPDIKYWGGPYRIEPVPEEWAVWYAEVEACWGMSGNFGAIEWYGASRIKYGDRWASGLIQGNRITMASRMERHLRHEMSHHVSWRGDELHYYDEYGRIRVPCDE